MASILSNQPSTQTTQVDQNPIGTVNSLVSQIMGAANPQEMFNQLLSENQDAQNAMNLINQYGNGDPKTAFLNYAAQQGKSNVAAAIMQKLGLK